MNRITSSNANISYDQKNFTIDSGNRTTGSISNFQHNTDFPREYDYDRISCISAEIPKAYYMLDTDATFELNEATGSVDTTVTISGGRNYTSSQLESALATALTAASATGANSFTYTVSFSANTGKFTITASSGDFQLTFNTTSAANTSISKYLGFAEGAQTASSSSSVLTSLNIANMQRYDVLYIRSNLVNNSGNDILAEVWVGSTIDLAMIEYHPNEPTRHACGFADNASFNSSFSLTDKDGKLIEMNGINWRFVFSAYKSECLSQRVI